MIIKQVKIHVITWICFIKCHMFYLCLYKCLHLIHFNFVLLTKELFFSKLFQFFSIFFKFFQIVLKYLFIYNC